MPKLTADQISKEANKLISCVIPLLDSRKVGYELQEIDLTHFESIWYEITIKTRPESGLKLVLHLFRDSVDYSATTIKYSSICLKNLSILKVGSPICPGS